jgi:eukaryotic-like serine/threonine-protein kinase
MAVRIESNAEPIPGYKLIERLGGGGFGDVWKVEAPGGLFKAIKFVYGDLQQTGEEGQRAGQELKALSRVKTVRHPYILSLERYDIIDDQLLIVMELADKNLWDRFKECRAKGLPGIPRPEMLRYMMETAEALDLMNVEYQLQHLDIKPQNIFLIHNHVKVADFGLVKDLEGMAASVTGGVTPVYAAPETFDGWVSRFSDQYSLAIVYQELLTGQRPFVGSNVRQLILQHLQATPNVASLPPEDRPIILKALAKNPDERHASCMDMVKGLLGNTFPPAMDGRSSDTNAELNLSDTPRTDTPKSGPLSAMPTADMRGPATQSFQVKSDSSPGRSAYPTRCLPRREEPMREPDPTAFVMPPVVEVSGDGPLMPALIVALGDQGLTVLQSFREALWERYGALESLPHVRMVYIDTDPEVLRNVSRGSPETVLAGSEILLARLNRASHFLRQKDGRLPIDSWFDPQMLFRIPRAQVTTGLRALGRLAFCDNYLNLSRRLREELTACSAPERLAAAARNTRLGPRTNQPRVYVITSLAGGTGGGMFLDLAYVIRSQLKSMGFAQPDTVGLFLLPGVDRNPARSLALGNTYAALKELNHYSNGGLFKGHYHEHEPAIQDADPPFRRCVLLPLPPEGKTREAGEVAAQAGEFLWRDLFTPLGRTADARRAARNPETKAVSFQTYGLYRFSSPRLPLIRKAARRICLRFVKQWMSKDAKPIAPAVTTWVNEHWSREEFGTEAFITRLQDACGQAFGKSPEAQFAAAIAPITQAKEPAADISLVEQSLGELANYLGSPLEESLSSPPRQVEETLAVASEAVVREWGQRLSELIVTLIEDPTYRLAGAEEAIRQVMTAIEKVLQYHEPLCQEIGQRAQDMFAQFHQLLDGLNRSLYPRGKVAAVAAEFRQLVVSYPKLRYQFLILRQMARGYISLRGNLSDELREVGFCRARLGDLLKAYSESPALDKPEGATPERAQIPGRFIFPIGCVDLAEAVERFLDQITPEQVEDLHGRVQEMIHKQFMALIQVCLGPSNLIRNLEGAMQKEVEAFLNSCSAGHNVAELLLEQYPSEEDAVNELSTGFDEAVPELAGVQVDESSEVCVLSVPTGKAGERIVELAHRVVPDAVSIPGIMGEEILLYREWPNLDPARLEQLGPPCREAYRQMLQVEHYSPHSRNDVSFGDA